MHFSLFVSVEDMRTRLGDSVIRCVGYGHVGDGNLHLNMTTSQYDKAVMSRIEPFVYEWTSKYNGSISAEHGKKEDIKWQLSCSPVSHHHDGLGGYFLF